MEQNNERPVWMQDDLVKDIPLKKLQFLEKVFIESQGKSQKELMTIMLPLLQQAKKENLAFSNIEMSAAIQAIKKHSSSDEIKKIDEMLTRAKK